MFVVNLLGKELALINDNFQYYYSKNLCLYKSNINDEEGKVVDMMMMPSHYNPLIFPLTIGFFIVKVSNFFNF